MPAPSTVDEFVDLVRKSAVLDEPRLAEYVQRLKSDPTAPKDPSGVAGLFVRDGLLTYFQAEQVLQGKWKRFSVGKYKVLEKLGSGGMGQVFLCEHKLMRRRVAVKVLPTAKAQDPSSLERFYREARAVAALDHPNIVRAYDIDQDDNLHFLVMEYVDGASLQEMIKKTGPMEPTRACHYIYWSAVGLQHAHANGLIHRDIKPGNILVDRLGVVKILDLGLARFFNDDQDLLTKKYDESVLGTADYLAPEQAVDSHTVDGRADIYSLGATFYFLLTGQPPFAEGTVAQKLLWHQTRSPKPVRVVRPQVTDDVARLLDKMMSKRPEDRYATPAELAEALLPLVQTPIAPPPDEEMPRLSAAAQANTSGTVPVQAPPRPVPAGPQTPPPARPQRTPAGPTPAPPPIAAARGGNGVAMADADTQRAKPSPVVEPLPEAAHGAQIWAAISADTANNSRTDTDRTKRESRSSWRYKKPPEAKSALRKSDGPKSGRRKDRPPPGRLILVMAVGAVLLVAAGAAVYWFVIREKKPETGPQRGPRTVMLTKNATGPNQFSSIKAASTDMQPGDQFVIQDEEWDEVISLSGAKNLVISSPTGKRVTWRAPAGKPGFLLQLFNTDGVRVSGIRFDCGGRAEYAVKLAGACPGLILEDVEVIDATVAGVGLHECAGEKGRPVTIRRAYFGDTGAKEKDARPVDRAAVLVSGKAGAKEVDITECTVDGGFSGGAIQFDGPALEVDIRRCRVRADYGVYFRKRPEGGWRVDVVGNTFLSLAAGVRFEDIAQFRGKNVGTQIRLAQNYFFGPGQVSRIDADSGAQLSQMGEGNFRKRGTPAGDRPAPQAPPPKKGDPEPPPMKAPPPLVPTVELDVDLPTESGPRFLRYDRQSPLAAAYQGKPVGAPPD